MSNESTSKASQGAHNKMPHEGHDTQHAPEAKPVATGVAVTALVFVLIILAALATFGILSRIHRTSVLAKSTQELAAPVVIALAPKQGAPADTFTLPGNVTAYTDSPIYARVLPREVREIEIELRTMDGGRLVPFAYGVVLVVLIFKKVINF